MQGRAFLPFWVCTVPGSQKFLLAPRSLTAIAESITEINVFLSYFRNILWSRAFKRSAQLSKSLDKAVVCVGGFPSAKLLHQGQKKPLCKQTWALHNILLAAHISHSRLCGTVSPAQGASGHEQKEHDIHSSQQLHSPAVSLWLWMKAAPGT